MIRIDKYISNLKIISRRAIPFYIKKGLIYVNGKKIDRSDFKVNLGDEIRIKDIVFNVIKNFVVCFYKPLGYISSDVDEIYPSYKKLLNGFVYKNIIKIAGRLDVDAEGLLLLSDNGNFIHKIISPKNEKLKYYYIETVKDINDDIKYKISKGINIGFQTKPSFIYEIEDSKKFFSEITFFQIPNKPIFGKYNYIIILQEGKYHQIKRMISYFNNEVKYIKRLKIDKYELYDLKPGERKIFNIEN